jgi:hypothetical protein
MLFDARSFVAAPSRGGGNDAIGEEAVDDAGQEILQVLDIAGDGDDLVPVSLICNEGIDAVVGIHEPGNDPEAKLFSRNVSSICSIVRNGYRPLAPLGRIRTSVSIRYGFEKYA